EAGKHVYCQKPLCHDVAEARAVAEAAKKHGRITQLGTQAASGVGDLMAVQHLRNGVLGRVKKVIVCSNRPGAIANYRPVGPRPDKTDPVPETLNWDLWLGSAPERPFVNGIYHPVKWRGWQDFGTGWLGDIGCHVFDSWWKGLQLTAPTSVIANVQESWRDAPERRGDTWPQSVHVTWTFDGVEATGGQPFTVEWFDGLMVPPAEAQEMAKAAGFSKFPSESSMVVGEEGSMIVPNSAGPRLSPTDKFVGVPRPVVPARNHYHHFVDACLGGEKTESFFEQTGPMTETILLGTVAVRMPDTKLEWNAKEMKVTNVAAANKYLGRTYRKGW
ncbi:MAG: putative dehydrogenase, partial [Kiritimatiellia bacterium]